MGVPKRIPDDEEGDVDFIRVFEDVVAGRFDHFAVGDGDGAAIESFLLSQRHQLAIIFLDLIIGSGSDGLTKTSFSTSRTAV